MIGPALAEVSKVLEPAQIPEASCHALNILPSETPCTIPMPEIGYPFVIHEYHADNGSEYINHRGAFSSLIPDAKKEGKTKKQLATKYGLARKDTDCLNYLINEMLKVRD